MSRPALVLLDVNETLSDLTPLRGRLADVGAPAHLLDTWFAGTLRDGFALASTGTAAPFPDLGAAVLAGLLHGRDLDRSVDDAVAHVLDGFSVLDVHPDVGPGLRRLRDAGVRAVPFTNGSRPLAEALLERAGLLGVVERVLSVDDAGRWKPHVDAYTWALRTCGVDAGEAALLAVHPWDVHGARRAGLTAGWLSRDGGPYPSPLDAPDVTAADLPTLVDALLG